MKILLTGGSGMVGRSILNVMTHSKNFEVYAPDRNDLDLLKKETIEDFIQKYSPELIIHAAGKVGGIQANILDPISFLTDNLQMGKILLQ